MTSLKTILRGLIGGASLSLAGASAMAADLGAKDMPAEPAMRQHTVTVNGGLTSDYVFRGQSQSDEGPAVFAGIDLAYGMFYAGFWSSSVADYVSTSGVEIDVYAGVKKSYNGVDFDFGVIYYAYPDDGYPVDVSYVELKAAASARVWRDITLTGTVFWSPEYSGESGEAWTLEGKFTAPLHHWGLTLSGAVGHVMSDDDALIFSSAFGEDNYTYWNIGLSRTFREHFTVDVRYWGTDADPLAELADDIVDDRFVATLTFNY